MEHTTDQHFDGREPFVREIYNRLLIATNALGAFTEDPKKTSIHLTRRIAFAGVQSRRNALIITLKSSRDIDSPRITKHEQVSAHRWHLDVRLSGPTDVDGELVGWLTEAFALAE